MANIESCCSSSNVNQVNIYACSGASNTGLISDRVARNLTLMNKGKMRCSIAVAAKKKAFLEKAENSKMNVVIDGCETKCVASLFEQNNINYKHFVITQLGVQKNKTLVTDEIINNITTVISDKI